MLASLRHRQFRVADAVDALETSLAIKPEPWYHSNLLNLFQYVDGVTAETLAVAHREWDRLYVAPMRVVDHSPQPVLEEPRSLRLGFVSAEFHEHPMAFFVLPVLEHLNKAGCTVFCYGDSPQQDDYTARFRAAADHWRPTAGRTDAALADQIRRDDVDILFDLMGHNGKRLLTFARKPAPVKVTWLGYVGTTGMEAMDFLLADRYHVPPGEERFYTEQVLRLPHGYACYAPPLQTPEVSPLPALESGQITFGSFNNPCKFSPSTFDAWAAVLRSVPNSQLLVKYFHLEREAARDWVSAEFAQRMIAPDRILVEGGCSHFELMESYGRIDIALDTQPYSGGLTTCEALWMGVPVITFSGKSFAGRHATSHLANAGYPYFVAGDAAGYVAIAVDWSKRLLELASLRSTMREQVRGSVLCNASRFAHDFLELLTGAWQASLQKRTNGS